MAGALATTLDHELGWGMEAAEREKPERSSQTLEPSRTLPLH